MYTLTETRETGPVFDGDGVVHTAGEDVALRGDGPGL